MHDHNDSRLLAARIALAEQQDKITRLRSAINSLIKMHDWKLSEYQGWTKENQKAAYDEARRALEETV